MAKKKSTRERLEIKVATVEQHVPVGKVSVTVPVGIFDATGYVPRRVDITIDRKQARAMKVIADGLDRDGAKVASGLRVTSVPMAVRWIIEQVCLAMEAENRS